MHRPSLFGIRPSMRAPRLKIAGDAWHRPYRFLILLVEVFKQEDSARTQALLGFGLLNAGKGIGGWLELWCFFEHFLQDSDSFFLATGALEKFGI